MNIWQNVQQLHGALIHILDNDTSARAGNRKPVRDRCGRCNEPSLVWIFLNDLSADESREDDSGLSWADNSMPRGGIDLEVEKLLRYSMQLAMLRQLLSAKKITDLEYQKIVRKLKSDYGIVSDIVSCNSR